MESKVISTSEKILTLVREKGSISFTELEDSIDDSYNVIFLAIDRLVRANKLTLQRKTSDYFITTTADFTAEVTTIKNNHAI